MKTTLEAIDIVWSHLGTSSLKAALITGGAVYKLKRPLNSIKEDVVVNSLAINNEQLQEGVLNVNVHVPDKKIKKADAYEYVPDFAALSLSSIAW